MVQLSLQFSHNKDILKDYFEKMTGKRISLVFTENSTSLLSMRTKGDLLSLRMHWMFLSAGEEVIREIADFAKRRKCRTPLIRKFINDHQACLRKKEQNIRQLRVCAQGRFYNLREIFDGLNNEYFRGKITASIIWGKGRARKAVKKRTLGSYCGREDMIRINPVLDRKYVPKYFMRYIVYHEMLHSVLRDQKKNDRRSVHPPEFRKRERLFKDYAKSISWERKWI